jgi:DGQHR domain-containing protein
MTKKPKTILCRAIRVEQGNAQPVFQFILTLRDLLDVANVSRIEDVTLEELVDYKRPDVRKMVDKLTEVAKSPDAPFPYPITVALSSRVRFRQSRGPKIGNGTSQAGVLEIPIDESPTRKAALIVDGHFPLLAACRAMAEDLPLAVFAFASDDELVLREQFQSIAGQHRISPNQADQLIPKGLVSISSKLSAKEVPIIISDWLNVSEASPFHGLVKGARKTVPKQKEIVAAGALSRMVDESLSTPSGILFPYRNIATGETDFDGICRVLILFWTAVKSVFSEAWGKPAAKSRLMHPAGIRCMGRLMDRIMPPIRIHDDKALTEIESELRKIEPICHWTSGRWEELDIKWDEVQNVPRHIHALSSVLIRAYIQA